MMNYHSRKQHVLNGALKMFCQNLNDICSYNKRLKISDWYQKLLIQEGLTLQCQKDKQWSTNELHGKLMIE